MITEALYNKAVKYASLILYREGLFNVEAEEIVNTAFLKLIDNNLEQTSELLHKQITNCVQFAKHNTIRMVSLDSFDNNDLAEIVLHKAIEKQNPNYIVKHEEHDDIKKCTYCKHKLPIEYFGQVFNKHIGKYYLQSRCKKCLVKIRTEQRRLNPGGRKAESLRYKEKCKVLGKDMDACKKTPENRAKRRDWSNQYYYKNKEEINLRKRGGRDKKPLKTKEEKRRRISNWKKKDRLKNLSKERDRDKIRYKSNKDNGIIRKKPTKENKRKWYEKAYKKNREQILGSQKRAQEDAIINLKDTYIKQLLALDGFTRKNIPKELIEFKRLIVKSKRILSQPKNK